MIQELIEKYSNTFPFIIDIKNIGANKITVPFFDAVWAEDHGQVAITVPMKNVKYKEICHTISNSINKFNLVTFELISGEKEKFKEQLFGEMIYDDGNTRIQIPVVPLIVLDHPDNLRYFLMEFVVGPKSTYKMDIPGGCQIRASLYPVDMTPEEIATYKRDTLKQSSENSEVAENSTPSSHHLLPCGTSAFAIVNTVASGLKCSPEQALDILAEVFINNLNLPSGNQKVHDLLNKEEWKPIIVKLKEVWGS